MEQKLHPVLSVRLFTDEKCFGPGVAALLTLVKTCHSLRAAAMEMGMAYSKAWTILKNAEEQLGFKLLLSTTGGNSAINGGQYAAYTSERAAELQQKLGLEPDTAEKHIEDTIKGFNMILDGEVDNLPEQAFLNVGTIEDAIAKGKRLLEAAKG